MHLTIEISCPPHVKWIATDCSVTEVDEPNRQDNGSDLLAGAPFKRFATCDCV